MMEYDLTGANPLYLRTGKRYRVYEDNQPIEFGEPVFADSVSVIWLDDNEVDTTPLTEGVHWDHGADNRDHDGMSRARLSDPAFTDELIHSIRNIDNFAGSRIYVVQYQALQLAPSEWDYGVNGPTPNPGLMQELIDKVRFLSLASDPLTNITSTTLDIIQVMEEDVTGVNDDNLVIDEVHTVNVPAGQKAIRTSAGAFYQHDVVVKNDSDDVLVEGTDYVITGLNMPKTKTSEHTSGVFDYIFMLTAYVGNVKVSYRGFGGEVTTADILSIKDVLADLVNVLSNNDFLTSANLPLAPIMTQLIARIDGVADDVEHYTRAKHTYAAGTDGKHWFTIGELYRDDADTQTLKQGQARMFIKSYTDEWTYDVTISMGLERTINPLRLQVHTSSDRVNHHDLGVYPSLENRNVPELRLVWKTDGGSAFSGALLQVGMHMVHDEQHVLLVTDQSGNGSEFTVRPNIVGDDATVDDDIVLPDLTVWQAGQPNNFEARALMCPTEGYLAWAGSRPMTDIVDVLVQNTVQPDTFDLDNIKSVSVFVYDRISDQIRVESAEHYFVPGSTTRGGSIMFYLPDLCSMNYVLVSDGEGGLDMTLTADMGTHSINNERFDLRQIVFNF